MYNVDTEPLIPFIRRKFPPLDKDVATVGPMLNDIAYCIKSHWRKKEQFSELSKNHNPKTLLIWRKTKAGMWELVSKLWYRQGAKSEKIDYVKLAQDYKDRERSNTNGGYDVAYKITTAKGKDGMIMGKQIYNTKYEKFYCRLRHDFFEGLIINKKTYIGRDSVLEYIRKLSKEHKGIRLWKEASDCTIDNHLIWGHLVMNDGYTERVAIVGYTYSNSHF